jgi:hypothetical protein
LVAVGAHTPPEHVMFCVAAVEIVTAACADDEAAIATKAAIAVRLAFIFVPTLNGLFLRKG